MTGGRWPRLVQPDRREQCIRRMLFLSHADAARGPMAAALLREMGAGSVGANSAGILPAPGLHSLTHAVMGELGISMAAHTPKPTIAVAGIGFDIVIFLCRNTWETNSTWVGSPTVRWFYDDPVLVPPEHGQRLKAFQTLRDSLAHRIEQLLNLPLETTSRRVLAGMIGELPE